MNENEGTGIARGLNPLPWKQVGAGQEGAQEGTGLAGVEKQDVRREPQGNMQRAWLLKWESGILL